MAGPERREFSNTLHRNHDQKTVRALPQVMENFARETVVGARPPAPLTMMRRPQNSRTRKQVGEFSITFGPLRVSAKMILRGAGGLRPVARTLFFP